MQQQVLDKINSSGAERRGGTERWGGAEAARKGRGGGNCREGDVARAARTRESCAERERHGEGGRESGVCVCGRVCVWGVCGTLETSEGGRAR